MTIIVFDPGHGGKDPGAVANGLREKDITLRLAEKARIHMMENYVCDVRMTREKDEFVTLESRTKFANHHKADFFYSFHVNASGGEGFESYIYNQVSGHSLSPAYQEVIHNYIKLNIVNLYHLRDRGKKRNNYHVLRETIMPAVLSEYFFIDNPKEAALLKDGLFVNELAYVTAEGIALALKLKRRVETTPKDQKLYIVQAGAFKDEDGANRRLSALKEAGFLDAFIKQVD